MTTPTSKIETRREAVTEELRTLADEATRPRGLRRRRGLTTAERRRWEALVEELDGLHRWAERATQLEQLKNRA